MPTQAPYMPVADVPLRDWALNFTTLLSASPATYGRTVGEAADAAAAYAAYDAALTVSLNPNTRTPVAVATKNYERATMRAVLMPLATAIAGDAGVTVGDKTAIGVTVRITTRTRASIVDVPLELTMEAVTQNYVTLRSQNPDTPDTTARPQGARVWEIAVRVRNAGDTADEVNFTRSGTRRFENVATDPAFRGRRCLYKARWVGANLQGGAQNVGAWSAEVETILP